MRASNGSGWEDIIVDETIDDEPWRTYLYRPTLPSNYTLCVGPSRNVQPGRSKPCSRTPLREKTMPAVTDTFTLSNGVEIPRISFGTWQIPDGPVAYDAVTAAIDAGYRHIDTARA